MKHARSWLLSLSLVVVVLIGAACAAPAATPQPAAPAAPAAATKAPAAAPTTAPAAPAATAAPAAGAKPAAYKVGLVNHLTGDAAAYGQSMKKGTDLALDVINGKGGVGGVPLQVIYEDDRLSAADAQTAFLKLVQSDKVPVIMGSGSSSISLSLCPKAQEMKVVQISSISTAPSLANCGKYFFSAMASDVAQGPEWVNVAKYLKATEVAVMYINNDYGIGVKDSF
ncbi:MAG TPA: ABC transporter substrate-binding protein, partial [Anaerolineae bacterium]